MPRGYNITETENNLVLMISVSDSLGGITNITKAINVRPDT